VDIRSFPAEVHCNTVNAEAHLRSSFFILLPFVRELSERILLVMAASAKLATFAMQHRHRPKLQCGIVPSLRCG